MGTYYTDLNEIEEIISSIKTLSRDNLHWNFSDSQIWTHLHHLKDFLTHLDDGQDLLDVVDDFIEIGNTVTDMCKPCRLNDKLLIKTNIIKLEEAFENYKTKKTMYGYLFHR